MDSLAIDCREMIYEKMYKLQYGDVMEEMNKKNKKHTEGPGRVENEYMIHPQYYYKQYGLSLTARPRKLIKFTYNKCSKLVLCY